MHRQLLQYQEKSVAELSEMQLGNIDLKDMTLRSINQVKGRAFNDALAILASSCAPPKVTNLRQHVMDMTKHFPLSSMMTTVTLSSTGKIVETRPSLMTSDPEEKEAAIKAEMYSHASLHHNVNALGIIEPARQQIVLEHPVRVEDFMPLVSYNPFIPHDREEIYARGLHAGLTVDFLVSTHLLLPQLENSIRHILSVNGEIVSGLDDDRIQDERNLNQLLFMPALAKLIGEDTVFDLQGILVERFGSNMRNNTALGLVNIYAFSVPLQSYIWWLILRLCVMYKLLYLRNIEKQNDTGRDEDQQKAGS